MCKRWGTSERPAAISIGIFSEQIISHDNLLLRLIRWLIVLRTFDV